MAEVEVSVVLPAYNEAGTLERTVERTLDALADFLDPGTYEVLIAEDGCTDATPAIAARMADTDERVRHVHSDERLGRGAALERAFRAAAGETLVYFDTDLATDLRHLEELVDAVRSGEYDVATGSRWIPGHVATREPDRRVASRGFNSLVRLFLRSDVRDHQCGFKAFDRTALFELLPAVQDAHWFWDTEVLVRAQRRGFRVKEFAVDWEPMGDTSVDLIRDVFGMGSGVVRVWWQLAVRPRITRRVTLAGGTLLVLAAIALMTQYIDVGLVLAEVRGAEPVLVGVAALVYVLSWPLRGVRYRDILTELGFNEDVGFLTGAIFVSQTGNLVFPARAGDAVRAYVVKARRAIPYPTGFASLAVERVVDLLTITALAGVVLVALAATGLADLSGLEATAFGGGPDTGIGRSGRTALAVAAVVGLAAIAVTVAILLTARLETDLVRRTVRSLSTDAYAEEVASVVGRFVADVQTVASDRRAFARIGLTSVAIWSLDVLTALAVFIAFDAGVPVGPLLAVGFLAVSVGNLAKVLPLSPGGIGLYEGAFTLIVVALLPGVSPELALGVAIVDHAIKNVVTIAGGVAATGLLNVSLTRAVEEAGREEVAVESDPGDS